MRVTVAVAVALVASPSMACDWLCQDSRRERAQMQSELSADLRQMETNHRLRAIEDEVRTMRREAEDKRISDDYWRPFDSKKRY